MEQPTVDMQGRLQGRNVFSKVHKYFITPMRKGMHSSLCSLSLYLSLALSSSSAAKH